LYILYYGGMHPVARTIKTIKIKPSFATRCIYSS
jgi:hypothetical protein